MWTLNIYVSSLLITRISSSVWKTHLSPNVFVSADFFFFCELTTTPLRYTPFKALWSTFRLFLLYISVSDFKKRSILRFFLKSEYTFLVFRGKVWNGFLHSREAFLVFVEVSKNVQKSVSRGEKWGSFYGKIFTILHESSCTFCLTSFTSFAKVLIVVFL